MVVMFILICLEIVLVFIGVEIIVVMLNFVSFEKFFWGIIYILLKFVGFNII